MLLVKIVRFALDRPLSRITTLTHDRPVWLKRPSTIVLDRPLWLKWPSTLRIVHFHPFWPSTLDHTRPLSSLWTVHFGPDSKCSLLFISIFWTKMLRSSFETRSLLILSFLSNIEIPVRVSHKSLTDLQATLMTDLGYFFDISWFLISQTTF